MSGEDDIRRAIDDAEEPVDGEEVKCPVIALGERNRIYYFIAASGEIHELGPRDFNPMGLTALFGGKLEWLIKAAPKLNNEGKPTGGFVAQRAGTILIRKCALAGLWNTDTAIRSIGVWRGEKKALVIHAGDAVLSTGEEIQKWQPAGRHVAGAIYVAAPPIERPAAASAPLEIAQRFRAGFDLWAYAHPASPKMVFGWTVAAMLGSAPSWRANLLITAERGSGKTQLQKYARSALGPQARTLNNFSEAGLRQLLTREAIALMLDEAEGDGTGARINAVIELIRQMTGEEGVQGTRGTAGGTATSFSLASPTWLSAINPPALLPQDRSRIFEVELMNPDPHGFPAVLAAIEFAAEQSAALRARAIAGWPRFLDNLAVYREALIGIGCDGRQADQIGTLLAAAEMMVCDEPIDGEGAAGDVDKLRGLIRRLVSEDREESDPLQCWNVLMTRQVEHWAGGAKSTVARLILYGLDPDEGTQARNALRIYGLRLDIDAERPNDHALKGTGPRLFVANTHESLRVIFRDTRWKDGGWRRSLLRLSGSASSPEPVRFDGYKSRCVIVSSEHLPEPAIKPPPKEKDESAKNDSPPPPVP